MKSELREVERACLRKVSVIPSEVEESPEIIVPSRCECLDVARHDILPRQFGAERLLNNQYEQQLSPTDLRAFDHQRAALAQFRFSFEQKLFLFVKL
jgi:hypothetical protein